MTLYHYLINFALQGQDQGYLFYLLKNELKPKYKDLIPLYDQVCYHGHLTLFDHLIKTYPISLHRGHTDLAALHGHFGLMRALVRAKAPLYITAFLRVIRSGSIKLFSWILRRHSFFPPMIDKLKDQVQLYRLAVLGGSIDIFNKLLKLFPLPTEAKIEIVIREAARTGQLEMIRLLAQKFKLKTVWFEPAAKHNQVEIIRWLVENQYKYTSILIPSAIEGGWLDLVKYLIKQTEARNPIWLLQAAGKGYFEIVTYLYSIGVKINPKFFQAAARGGYESIFDWGLKRFAEPEKIKEVKNCLKRAVKGNYGSLVRKLIKLGCPIQDDDILAAVENRNLEMVIYLRNLGGRFAFENENDEDYEANIEAFRRAIIRNIQKGNLAMLQYLHQIGLFDDYRNVQYSLLAVNNGYLEILIWLDTKGFAIDPTIINIAVRDGYLEIVKWCYQKGMPIHRLSTFHAIKNGYYDLLFWLVEQRAPLLTATLSAALQRSDFDLAQWLYDRSVQPMKSLYDAALISGDRRVIDWLDQHGHLEPLDVFYVDDVGKGNFEVLKELVDRAKKPNFTTHLISRHINSYFDLLKYIVSFGAVITEDEKERLKIRFGCEIKGKKCQLLKSDQYTKVDIFEFAGYKVDF